MKENLIIPVKLDTNQGYSTVKQTPKTESPSPVCHLKLNEADVLFYNGIDKPILYAVLSEVSKNAR